MRSRRAPAVLRLEQVDVGDLVAVADEHHPAAEEIVAELIDVEQANGKPQFLQSAPHGFSEAILNHGLCGLKLVSHEIYVARLRAVPQYARLRMRVTHCCGKQREGKAAGIGFRPQLLPRGGG